MTNDLISKRNVIGIVAAYRAEIRQLLHLARNIRHILKGECRLGLPMGDAVVVVSGPGASNARNAAIKLVKKHKLFALVSVGFAGGLSESVSVGSIVISDRIIESASGIEYACASDLFQNVNGQRGTVITAPTVAATRVEKARISSRWKAIAVEMEAAAVAKVAAESGLRFAALKAITDAKDDELAIDFRRCLTQNGELSSVKIVVEGFKGRAQFRSLLLLARNSRLAAGNLAKALTMPHSHL